MKFIDTTINIVIEKPFELLHISDIHLTYADGRDDARKLALAADRLKYFPDAEENLAAAVADAKRTGALMISTGDLIDFVSYANIDAARKFTDENDCFFAAGNHEFSLLMAFCGAPQRVLSRDQLLELSRLHRAEVYDRAIDVQQTLANMRAIAGSR